MSDEGHKHEAYEAVRNSKHLLVKSPVGVDLKGTVSGNILGLTGQLEQEIHLGDSMYKPFSEAELGQMSAETLESMSRCVGDLGAAGELNKAECTLERIIAAFEGASLIECRRARAKVYVKHAQVLLLRYGLLEHSRVTSALRKALLVDPDSADAKRLLKNINLIKNVVEQMELPKEASHIAGMQAPGSSIAGIPLFVGLLGVVLCFHAQSQAIVLSTGLGGAVVIGALALRRILMNRWRSVSNEVNEALCRADRLYEQGLLKEALAELDSVSNSCADFANIVLLRRGKIVVELDKRAHEEAGMLKETIAHALMDDPGVIHVGTVATDMNAPRPWSYVVEIGVKCDATETRRTLLTSLKLCGLKEEDINSKVKFTRAEMPRAWLP